MPSTAVQGVSYGAPPRPLHDWLERWRGSTGAEPAELQGVHGGGRGYLLAALLRALHEAGDDPRPVVVVCPDAESARELRGDALFYLGLDPEEGALRSPVLLLGEEESLPFDGVPCDREAQHERLATLARLCREPAGVAAVVTSAQALLRRTIPRETLARFSDYLMVGEESERDGLIRKLLRADYEKLGAVEDPGQFAVRGCVVDLWPTLYSRPVRAVFFGDEIESLRHFDPNSQLATGRGPGHELEDLHVHPVREVLVDADVATVASERISQRADQINHPSRLTRTILDEIDRAEFDATSFFGIESLLPAFYPGSEPGFAYLPHGDGALWLLDDPLQIDRAADDLWDRLSARAEATSGHHSLTFEPADYFARAEALELLWHDGPCLRTYRAAAPQGAPESGLRSTGELRAALEARRGGEDLLSPLIRSLQQWHEAGRAAVAVCSDDTRAERFVQMMRDHGVEARRSDTLAALAAPAHLGNLLKPSPFVHVTLGVISEGVLPPGLPLAVVSESDVFGRHKHRARRKAAATPFNTSLGDLADGDFVVHVDFGIGVYRGLKRVAAGGKDGDYLQVEYRGGDKLYLPAYRIGALQRYVAPGGGKPRLDKMGSDAWQKTKARVKKALTALAGDLLNLYAQRELRAGHAFAEPDAFYREFESSFEYEETPDQLRAVEDTLKDMQKPRPMDRLICGDVGYGKTEVAMRAAFKAVEDGRQVAVLVPTTVLAQQHYNTFRKRFAGWPVNIGVLSRFLTAKEQAEVARGAAEGKVDILIGTHRLLQRDVAFKELGLFVVDEEQRFGVKDKERIKLLAKNVDCLTLSATPIPRTLHMSMINLRDLSVIATPPEDRQAVRTTVTRFSGQVIRDAVLAEKKRGGQVYFIHNRVGSMPAVRDYLQNLVPEARIGVAHGQMDGATLERRMVEFVDGEYDVLLSTAIVESGLDIPTANTLIVNRADQFGLAQLYQLRGRVGRSKERAYAWLLVPAKLLLTPKAQKRLQALSRFSELGAGFQIASHDLELRGAGDLLGRKQHGSMAAVGFDLYTELLTQAVDELRGTGAAGARPDPELKMSFAGVVPEEYVPDVGERLAIYRTLSAATTLPEVKAVRAAVDDRYGPAPEEVGRLIDITELKVRARGVHATFLEVAPTAAGCAPGAGHPAEPRQDRPHDQHGPPSLPASGGAGAGRATQRGTALGARFRPRRAGRVRPSRLAEDRRLC